MRFATHMLLLAALLATAVAAPAPGIPKAPLVVTLSLSDDMKSIQADVTNTGADSLDVIILHTPLSTDDLGGYRVSDKTRVLRFQGFISAYITTNLSDYHQTITSGQTVTTLWSLSLIDFTNSIGPYHASASGIFQYRPTSADTDSNYLLGEYESNDFQFTHALPSIQARSNDTELVYTEGCNSGKEYTINAAGSDYGQLADAGVNALTGGQDTAFAEFFGKNVSPTQYRTVTNRFYDLQGAKGSANTREQQPIKFSFSCNDYVGGCKSGVGAMIALSYLCSTPSYQPSNDAYYYRGATLLHEFMHLESVMNSQPLNDETLNNGNRAYGYAAAKLLATQNAAKARKNPENYKYFAEVEYARKRGGACSRNEL